MLVLEGPLVVVVGLALLVVAVLLCEREGHERFAARFQLIVISSWKLFKKYLDYLAIFKAWWSHR